LTHLQSKIKNQKSKMSTLRTFVAVEISPEVRGRVADLIKQLKTSGADFKWVESQNLHFTLNFLGDVDERQIHEVCVAVTDAVATIEPFDITCQGAGAFPHGENPRVVWVGVEEGSEQMCALQAATEEALAALGFKREQRRFRPHLTIGRVRRGAGRLRELTEQLEKHADFAAGVTIVDEAVVFSSRLERAGPVYEPLATPALGGE
jgi:2'-5' RNA ligase